jgi:hypothetical protein
MKWVWHLGDFVLEDYDGSLLGFLRENNGAWDVSIATSDGEGTCHAARTFLMFEDAVRYVEKRNGCSNVPRVVTRS